MKKQKIIFLVFAVLAFIGLGIGCAALTDTLTLTTTVTGTGVNVGDNNVSDSEAFDIQWVSNEQHILAGDEATRAKAITVEAPVPSTSENTATLTVGNLCIKNDTVAVEFTIKNTSEYAASITLSLGTEEVAAAAAQGVVVEGGFGSCNDSTGAVTYINTTAANSLTTTVAAGSTTTFVVTVQLTKTLFTDAEALTNISIPATIVATAQNPNA